MLKYVKVLSMLLIFSLFSIALGGQKLSPTEGFLLPYQSAAYSDDALSLKFNPAGLGWRDGFQGYFLHTYSDSSFEGDYALFLSAGRLGFSAEWLGNETSPKYRKYTFGSGFKIKNGFIWERVTPGSVRKTKTIMTYLPGKSDCYCVHFPLFPWVGWLRI